MRTLDNEQLTTNFWLYEFIEGRALPARAIELNWRNIKEFKRDRYQELAFLLQAIRDEINDEFIDANGGKEIGITINSGFRCKQWELMRGRSGNSQHTVDAASDIVPVNCSNELAIRIIKYLHDQDWDRTTGHSGGFAIKEPVRDEKGQIVTVGFAHYDLRGFPARWYY